MIELRWVLAREQVPGTFSEPVDWPDRTTVYARLQYRDRGMEGPRDWIEIPLVSEVKEAPRVQLVPKGN